MTSFIKTFVLTFYSTPGVEGVFKDRIIMCLHVAAFVIPFLAICNMTMICKKGEFDLLTPWDTMCCMRHSFNLVCNMTIF